MYCDTPQVNQLTALLEAHHIRHIVVCPGSRNATIAHNLNEKGENCFTLHPITDERSAAFVAIGLILATQECTAVCVTSGSALINCIPAVADWAACRTNATTKRSLTSLQPYLHVAK